MNKLCTVLCLISSTITFLHTMDIEEYHTHRANKLPKFDELPMFTHFNPESPAVLPLSWQELHTRNDIYAPFPTLIKHYFDTYTILGGDNVFFDFINKKTISQGACMDAVEDLCSLFLISPQTRFYLEQAFLHIIQGTEIDVSDERLVYNEAHELDAKVDLVEQLPTMLADMVKRSKSKKSVNRILAPFSYSIMNSQDTLLNNGLDRVAKLVRDYNSQNTSWYFNAISPHTTVYIAEEYCKLVKNGTPVEYSPYDSGKERNYFNELIQYFPKTLKVSVDDRNQYTIWQLAFKAYWLLNPHWKRVLSDEKHTVENLIKNLRPLCTAHEFAQCFGLLTYYQDYVASLISTTDNLVPQEFLNTLNKNAIALSSNSRLSVLSGEEIIKKLLENIPYTRNYWQ